MLFLAIMAAAGRRKEKMPDNRPSHDRQRSTALPALPLVVAVAFGFALLGVMLAATACWSGDHMSMMRRGSAGADQTPVVTDQAQVTVEMRGFEFFPAKLTVNAGTELTWVNRDNVPHNAIADGGAFATGNVNGGKSESVVLDRPGTYRYVCTFHPGMEATLTVR
jgi:plastocyanin